MHRRGWAILGALGCAPKPFVTVDTMYLAFGTLNAMWLAFQALDNNKTPAINGEKKGGLPASSSGVRSSSPSRPRPARNGRGQGRTPSQSPAWQTGSCNSPVVGNISKYIPGCTDTSLDTSSDCWHLDEHHFAEIFAACSSIQTNDPLLWIGVLTITARAAALRETGAIVGTATKALN